MGFCCYLGLNLNKRVLNLSCSIKFNTQLSIVANKVIWSYKPKYRENKFYFFFYLTSASISTPCRWDQFTVFHLVSKEFDWSRSTQDPTLFTGLLLWPCRIASFKVICGRPQKIFLIPYTSCVPMLIRPQFATL